MITENPPQHSHPPRCLLITTVWPEWTSSAAGVRTLFLAKTFQTAGYEVTLQCSAVDSSFRFELEKQGFKTHPQAINDDSFDVWISTLQPDLVIFDRFVIEEQFGWRIRNHSPHTLLILDTQDLHFLRRFRAEKLKHSPDYPLMHLQESETLSHLKHVLWTHSTDAIRELSSIQRCDLSLLVSDFEIALLQSSPFNLSLERLLLCRWGVRPQAESELPSWENREGLVWIGNFRHPPNHDGVLWFHREIWPILKQKSRNRLRVHLYGAYAPREISNLHSPSEGFLFHGWAPSETDVLKKAQVNLAPLRFGAGIKGKILEGWRAGTPCVGTSIASEGMTEGTPFGGLIANTPETFADAILQITDDSNGLHFREFSDRGRAILQRYYSPEQISQTLLERVHDLRSNFESTRKQNFWGAVLNHETMARTKYFSQWIEAKTKSSKSEK